MLGSERLLYIKVGGDWFPIGCLTSNSFSETVQTIDTSFRGNTAGWQTVVPTVQTASISFSGIATNDDRGGTVITFSDIKSLKRNRTEIEWQVAQSDGTWDAESGSGYIVSLSEASPLENFVSFEGEILVSGAPTTGEYVPPASPELVDMIPYYETGKS